TRAVSPAVTRVGALQGFLPAISILTACEPTGMAGTLKGVCPTLFPSIRTVAPRGRESTKIDPVNDAGVEGDGAAARGAGAARSSGTSLVSIVCAAVPAFSVTSSCAATKPGCTTRTLYFPNARLSSVNGVRPRHVPLIVTPARDGVDFTTSRPVVATGFAAAAAAADVLRAGARTPSVGTGGASRVGCGVT